jgi:hypothetical protein
VHEIEGIGVELRITRDGETAFVWIRPKAIDRDIRALSVATEAVSKYASRTVAHRAWEHPPPLNLIL